MLICLQNKMIETRGEYDAKTKSNTNKIFD